MLCYAARTFLPVLAIAISAELALGQYRQVSPYGQPAGVAQPDSAVISSRQPQPATGPVRQPVVANGHSANQGPQQMLRAPFVLTPQEQATLDWVLKRWEEQSSRVKTFEAKFVRFEYDSVFNDGRRPVAIDQGEIKYVAPDKGLFHVYQPPDSQQIREEKWVCNGKSIFEFDYQKKQLIEYRLPPEVQGNAISEGPLPFVFGAKADTLKRRYFMRIVTPQQAKNQIWIEAWPKWQEDAADFQRATVILWADTMLPFAIEIVSPSGKNRMVYRLDEPKVNARNLLDPLNLFSQAWLNPKLPPGWSKVVQEYNTARTAADKLNSMPR